MKTIRQFPRKVQETENLFITLADGTRLAARVWMPTDALKKPVPAILPRSPSTRKMMDMRTSKLSEEQIIGF